MYNFVHVHSLLSMYNACIYVMIISLCVISLCVIKLESYYIVNNKQKINVHRDVNKINELLYACMSSVLYTGMQCTILALIK